MKRFTFSLEAVLKQRAARLEAAQRALGAHQQAYAALLAAIEDDEAALRVDDAPQVGALFDPRQAALRGRHRAALRAALDQKRADLKAAQAALEAAQATVTRAYADLKVMERLKEKARVAWAHEALVAEQKEADEQSQLRRG
ncbi:hypothetical protein KKF91_02110 [Myxococcota bacterium]|nr:hypothetical protein [Myxococcota bacterium]MBU1429332.1 hypothetical protein [Myxococcota bacterium]MBU1898953.1 hypothetical protein [Myxococcota bacterium]